MRKSVLLCGAAAAVGLVWAGKRALEKGLAEPTFEQGFGIITEQAEWLDRAVTERDMKLHLLGVGRILKLTPSDVRKLAGIGAFRIHWSPWVGSYIWSQDLQAFLRVPKSRRLQHFRMN